MEHYGLSLKKDTPRKGCLDFSDSSLCQNLHVIFLLFINQYNIKKVQCQYLAENFLPHYFYYTTNQ